jgi:dynein heavy chain
MWYCLRDFQANTEKWKIQHILSINIENVEKELEEYADIAKIAANDLENTNIPEFLLSQTSTYKELIPALKSFQNPNVQEEKFRKEISQLLEQEIDFLNDPRTTLESLFNLNIPLHTPKIIEISNRANEEKVLKDKYHAIYKNYMEKKIPLNKYIRGAQQNEKSEKHYIKEEDIEIEYEYIDEKLLELQKMLLNPYCDIVRKDVVALVENYMKYLSFMDEYTRLQKYWFLSENYLQINQSELQKEFPVEIKKLSTIESQLKNSGKVKIIIKIKLVKDNNFVYKYNDFSHSKVIQTLKTLNIYYDEIYRAIEESLDKKRSEFSKYYFLSNEELLKIFSFPQNLDNLVNCISKLINGFKTIDFGAETDDTVKITTIDGEIIVFKIQKNKPQIKDYIEFIELEIEKKIKNSFRVIKLNKIRHVKKISKKTLKQMQKEFIMTQSKIKIILDKSCLPIYTT